MEVYQWWWEVKKEGLWAFDTWTMKVCGPSIGSDDDEEDTDTRHRRKKKRIKEEESEREAMASCFEIFFSHSVGGTDLLEYIDFEDNKVRSLVSFHFLFFFLKIIIILFFWVLTCSFLWPDSYL
ncbi:hypothetical protein TorRG33x02_206310 [Trema orientale]|uniref:Transmembrane protein n=1 Tax=Trema orientale TaxID=63057 RepID=A0A2P5EDF8_TREOI|nr:hypothetical protein TorRG33x02_206310 [Trema orientale]